MPCGEARIPTDPLEISRLAENELSRLTRQYRIMENDRVAFAEEANPKLKVQRKVIASLQAERDNLETDLKIAKSDRHKRKDEQIMHDISEMLTTQDKLKSLIKTEKAHVQEIDYQIKKVQNEICAYAKTEVTDKKLEERILHARRVVDKLENQLNVAVKKFNAVLAENDGIRQEINHLIKERAHFNGLWNKMVANLSKGKAFMMDLVEQATLAYDQRDEWCGKLEALKERGRADLLHHTQEMRELQRTLDHDAKLNEYLAVKGQRRIMGDLHAHEDEKRQKRRDEMEEHLRNYQRIFQQIKEFAREENIERLASQFIKQEEENFALFKYVNELNFELETLNDSVHDFHTKIDAQRAINEERAEKQKKRMNELAESSAEAKKKAETIEENLKKTQNQLSFTLKEIQKLFQLVKADNSPILKLLGDNAHVNIFNVRLYLEILEKRTNELIQIQYYKDKQQTKQIKKTAPKTEFGKEIIAEPPDLKIEIMKIDKIVVTQPCPLCVERELVSEVIETLQVPDNREEIKEKLELRLQLPDALDKLHNVSACKLPAARLTLQKRVL